MKIRPILREIRDKARQRERNTKLIFLLPILPTIIFTIVELIFIPKWNLEYLILFPFAISAIYLVSVAAILDVIFGYSIYEVLSPRFLVKLSVLNRKLKRRFNSPTRIVSPTPSLESQNTLVTPNIEKILSDIANTYMDLANPKMPEVVTGLYKNEKEILENQKDIFQRLERVEQVQKPQQYSCINSDCDKLFEAKWDDIFTIVMREKCEYCDILNTTMFRRKTFICVHCGTENHMYFHHKDGHTDDEIRLAERKLNGPDEF